MSKPILRGAILAAALAGSAVTQAATPASTDNWQTALALYGWFPTFGGSLKYPLPSGVVADVEAGSGDYLQDLKFAFMGSFLARKNDWSILADLIYLDLSGQTGKATAPLLPAGPASISWLRGFFLSSSLLGGAALLAPRARSGGEPAEPLPVALPASQLPIGVAGLSASNSRGQATQRLT